MNFKEKLAKSIQGQIHQPIVLESPPSPELGDFALHSYKLKLSPEDLRAKLKLPGLIEKTEIKGPYLNFFVRKKPFIISTLKEILKKKEKYGSAKKSKGRIMIEFSQANTHKAFHIGHIRGTSIGESIARISEFQGKKVLRANYQGDTGMHVAKWIWCYKNFHSNKTPPENNVESWIASIYVDAVKRLSENPDAQEKVDFINKSLESQRDPGLTQLWRDTRKLSLDALEPVYVDLNTYFDCYFFESDMEKPGKKIAKKLLKQGIAKKDDGATIIDLSNYNLGVWVLLRKDGTVLYSAKDLALANIKFKKYHITKSIYVVGDAQKMHIHQLFKTLELSGFKQVKDCLYIPVSEVRLPTGKMSSRTGENILYSEFKKELLEYACTQIKARHPGITEEEMGTRALAIIISALKYAMLKSDLNKPIIFDKQEALNFEGDTGPYMLYTYARASSILRKAGSPPVKHPVINLKKPSPPEVLLAKALSEFPEIALNAFLKTEPSLVANYAFKLSQVFNEFYHTSQVLGTKEESFRLALVQATKTVLGSALNLLAITSIEEM